MNGIAGKLADHDNGFGKMFRLHLKGQPQRSTVVKGPVAETTPQTVAVSQNFHD